MKKHIVIAFGIVLFIAIGYFFIQLFSQSLSNQNFGQAITEKTGASNILKFKPNKETRSSTNNVVLKIPVIRYSDPGNKLSEPIISSYENHIINLGSEFEIKSETLGYIYEKSVGDLKLKLVEIGKDWIKVEVIADKMFDEKYHPRSETETTIIKDDSCIKAMPLVMDVAYDYCFKIDVPEEVIQIEYFIESKSSMPH